ncbi:MAG: hypothetical protein WD205_04150, partial [Rhodothermales bacterium]
VVSIRCLVMIRPHFCDPVRATSATIWLRLPLTVDQRRQRTIRLSYDLYYRWRLSDVISVRLDDHARRALAADLRRHSEGFSALALVAPVREDGR